MNTNVPPLSPALPQCVNTYKFTLGVISEMTKHKEIIIAEATKAQNGTMSVIKINSKIFDST